MTEASLPQFEFTERGLAKDQISFLTMGASNIMSTMNMNSEDIPYMKNNMNFLKFQSTLNIIEEEKGGESPKVMGMSPSGGMVIPKVFISVENFNYRKNIYLFIQQERIRLIGEAIAHGIKEQDVEEYLSNNKMNDLYFDNLKGRLGIVDKKPPRTPRKKTLAQKQDMPS